MTAKTDISPQKMFDHGQAQLLPTPLRPSELIKRLQLLFAEERQHSEDPRSVGISTRRGKLEPVATYPG